MNKILKLVSFILTLADFAKELTEKIMATKKTIQGAAGYKGKSAEKDNAAGKAMNNAAGKGKNDAAGKGKNDAAGKNAFNGLDTYNGKQMDNATRGIRNNNPLNIRHSKNQWFGMKELQNDKTFVQFESRKFGYRAAFVLIRTYMVKHHANTIGKIIARWAPSSDGNNTLGYIRFVSKTTGIPVDEPLRFEDQKKMVSIVRSMAQMESGIIENEDILNEAYCMV